MHSEAFDLNTLYELPPGKYVLNVKLPLRNLGIETEAVATAPSVDFTIH
jgi:hypothetical protein